jgi:hypothetical protein
MPRRRQLHSDPHNIHTFGSVQQLMQDDANDPKIAKLKAQVARLELRVEALCQLLVRTQALSSHDLVTLERKLRSAAAEVDDAHDDATNAQPVVAPSGGPYRSVPVQNTLVCTSCGKALDREGPELNRAFGGRVCDACFVRRR